MTSSSLPRIDGFDVLAKIGEGGIGAVYLATTRDAARTRVAIKVLQSGVAIREKVLLRFAREGRVGQSLHHPHIVTVLGSGDWEGTRYIVMEYVDGTPLTRWLPTLRADEAPPPLVAAEALRERLRIVASVADALDFVHANGIVHRDVKTGNILVRSDGHPFLTDFGLAKNVEVDSTLTSTGAFMGTPAYMPPEQILGRWDDVDHRSDVYSLGVTLYEVVTGRLPFDGGTYETLREQIVEREPPRLAERAPGAPGGLEAVILRAMEKRRQDRYSSAGAMRDDLLRVVGGAKPRPGELSLRWRRGARRLVRQRVRIGAIVATAVAAALTVGLLVFRGESRAARASTLQQQGFAALDRGEFRQAVGYFDRLVALDPKSPEGHLCLASAYNEYSQTSAWKAEVETAVRLGFPTDPGSIETPFEAYCFGLYKRMSREYEAAESVLVDAIARDPALLQARFALYEVRRRLKKPAEAREALLSYKRNLREANPRFELAWAQLEEDDGNYGRAVEILLALRRDHPASVTDELCIARELGRSYLRLERYDDGEKELWDAIARSPEDGPSLANLAIVAESRERWAEAASLASRAIAVDPALEAPYRVLARCALARGDLGAAREALARSLDATGDEALRPYLARLDAETAYREGQRLHELNDLVGAAARFAECLRLEPDHFGANLLDSSNAYARGDLAAALARTERTLELFRKDTSIAPEDEVSAYVILFGVASALELEPRAREARRFLEAHPPVRLEDRVNYVEALAKNRLEAFRDVRGAKARMSDWKLREAALAAQRGDCVTVLDAVQSTPDDSSGAAGSR